jgi:2-polyprenyl-3-methyl-5-hydroxy-6-metoxy-1,4-benzoquinol methylase
MRFTPELICMMNPTYDLEKFEYAVKGKEEFLAYSQCRECGMIYCENYWDTETLSRVYEEVIVHEKSKDKTLAVRKRLGQVQNWKNILTLLLLMGRTNLDNLKVIDYGCGWGDLLDVISCEGVVVLGYDKYEITSHVPKYKKRLYATDVGELRSFGPVDVLLLMSVVEHLQDPDKVLGLAKELVKNNGIVAVRVMDYRPGFIKKNVRRVKNNLPALSKNLNPIEHVNLYNYSSMVKTLKKHDLRLLSTGNVLRLTDFGVIAKGFTLIEVLNKIERLSTKIVVGRDLMITAYARNMK